MSNGMQYGGFWRRTIAVFVDAFVFGFIALPLFFAIVIGIIFYVISMGGAASTTIGINEIIAGFVINLVILLAYIGYFAGMESSLRQATYGKMMLGVKVVDEDGFRISFWRAVGRYFAKYLSVFTLFIGFLMAAFTKKKQALHDMVAKTLVIKEGGCSLWPAIKAVLISILLFVLLVAGCVYYGYVKYGGMLDEKNIQEFFTELMSTATFSVNVDTDDPLSKTTAHLEEREDGRLYEQNKNLPFTGKYTFDYPNGQKKQDTTVVAGHFEGPYTIWYESGQKRETGTYEKGLISGANTFWDENGGRQERFLENGEFNGPYTSYYPNGQKEQEGTHKSNTLHGLITFWDEEGNFLETQKHENGTLVETSTTPPENLSEETFDLDNNNDASSLNVQLKESFHENGVKKMEAHYVDGKLNGSSTLWNEYGQKIIIVNYKEDKRHGLLTRWHNNGQKKIEINYTDDKRDGEMTFWNENGDVKKTLTYSNGELLGNNANESSAVPKDPPQADSGKTTSDLSVIREKIMDHNRDFGFHQGPTTITGPVLLQVGNFFDDLFKIEAYMLLNPQNEFNVSEIIIDNVLNQHNVNFHDPGGMSEKEFFRRQKFDIKNLMDADNTKVLRSERSVYFKAGGFNEEALTSVKGKVILYVPVNTETITFTPEEINQEKSAVGNTVKLVKSEQEDKWYTVSIELSNMKTFLKTKAYNANGEEIGALMSSHDESSKSKYYQSKPSKIDVLVCEKQTVNEYPFLLKK